MQIRKTRAIEKIENKIRETEPGSIRHRILRDARAFKTSWISLGRSLFAVWRDKLYKEWGFEEFETYIRKEIGIKKPTALKLVRSYSFLETKEPAYLKKTEEEGFNAAKIADYGSVDVLRRADNSRDIDREDYSKLKTYVLEEGKDEKDVRKDLTTMIKQAKGVSPAEERERRRTAVLKRFVGQLKATKKQILVSGGLPEDLLKEVDSVIIRIEKEIER
jgi:hypothetical protein